jgi:hypothetical protein
MIKKEKVSSKESVRLLKIFISLYKVLAAVTHIMS